MVWVAFCNVIILSLCEVTPGFVKSLPLLKRTLLRQELFSRITMLKSLHWLLEPRWLVVTLTCLASPARLVNGHGFFVQDTHLRFHILNDQHQGVQLIHTVSPRTACVDANVASERMVCLVGNESRTVRSCSGTIASLTVDYLVQLALRKKLTQCQAHRVYTTVWL